MPSDANRQPPPPGPTSLSARRGFGTVGGGDDASSDSFRLTGEILLVVYRNRAQGGSDFVGQVSFDLTEMASTGTVEFHRSGIQARSLRGSFPLIDRKGVVAGDLAHIDVQLELAWKPGAVAATTAQASSSSNAAMSLKGPPMRGPASVAASSKAGGASAKKSIAGSASMGPSTKNGASQLGNNMAPPRKIVSGSSKKKREDQYRIERENKALQARLASVTKKGKSSGHTSVKKAEDVYSFDPQPKKSKEEEAGIDPKFLRQVRSSSQSELQAQFAAMKKEVSDKEKENRELKATLSRLSLNTKKYTMTLDKIKKTMALNALPTNGKAPSKSNQNGENLTNEAKSAFASGGEEKEEFEQEEGDAKGGDGGGQSSKGLSEVRNAEEKEEVILDRELRECVAEHRILQEVRRGLVLRIENAKRARFSAEATLEEARRKEENIRMRLQAASSGSKSNGNSDGSGELQAIERLRAVRLELARTEAARDAGIHLGPLQDSFTELSAIDASLARLIEATEQEVDLATKERDKNQEQLRTLNENRVVSRLRDGINVMRTVLTRIRRQRRIKSFETGSDTIELEVLRLKLRREQLKG